jgi:hypothetical protein
MGPYRNNDRGSITILPRHFREHHPISEQWTDVGLPQIVLGIFMDVVDSIEDRTYPNGCGDPRGRGTLAL